MEYGKKIAIVGAHGTGKTTIAYGLGARLKKMNINVGVIAEVARESPYIIAGEINPEAEMNLLGHQLVAETNAIRNHELVICDRSVVDIFMYSKLLIEDWSNHMDYKRGMEMLIREYSRTYAAFFKTTTLYDLDKTEDRLRPRDRALQKQSDKMLEEVLDELNVAYHDIPQDDSIDFILGKLIEKGLVTGNNNS